MIEKATHTAHDEPALLVFNKNIRNVSAGGGGGGGVGGGGGRCGGGVDVSEKAFGQRVSAWGTVVIKTWKANRRQ